MTHGPVFWHQGLFLQPQHFQQTDLRTQTMLADIASAVRPWLWGVRELEWDAGALASGTVQPSRLRVIMPGMGEELSCPGNAVCAGRVYPENLNAGESIDVWLGLTVLKEGESNVTVCNDKASLSEAVTRFAVATEQPETANVYEESPRATVSTLKYVVQVVFGSEVEESRDIALMRVGRLRRTATGLTVDTSYAAPCLRLEDSPVLLGFVREVRDRVLVKTREIDGYKALAKRANMGDMTSIFLILRSLARFAPRLQLAVEMPVAPPWQCYQLLYELAGELSVFSTHINPLGEDATGHCHIIPYCHDDPAPGFKSLINIIVLLLDALAMGPRFMVPFEPESGSLVAHLPPHIFEASEKFTEYWITLHSEQINLVHNPDLVRLAKFSPCSDAAILVTRALPGLPCSIESQPPMGVPHTPQTVYLRVHTESPMWSKIRMQGGIALNWEGMPIDLQANFIVIDV